MPINIDAEDFLKIIKDNTFQKIFVVILIVTAAFFGGRATAPICNQKVICSDITEDRDRLSKQLSKQYEKCQTEKTQEFKDMKKDFEILCAERVDQALSGCEFSEELHCPICVVRGACQ